MLAPRYTWLFFFTCLTYKQAEPSHELAQPIFVLLNQYYVWPAIRGVLETQKWLTVELQTLSTDLEEPHITFANIWQMQNDTFDFTEKTK